MAQLNKRKFHTDEKEDEEFEVDPPDNERWDSYDPEKVIKHDSRGTIQIEIDRLHHLLTPKDYKEELDVIFDFIPISMILTHILKPFLGTCLASLEEDINQSPSVLQTMKSTSDAACYKISYFKTLTLRYESDPVIFSSKEHYHVEWTLLYRILTLGPVPFALMDNRVLCNTDFWMIGVGYLNHPIAVSETGWTRTALSRTSDAVYKTVKTADGGSISIDDCYEKIIYRIANENAMKIQTLVDINFDVFSVAIDQLIQNEEIRMKPKQIAILEIV